MGCDTQPSQSRLVAIVPIDTIKSAAGWSNVNAFAQFYLRLFVSITGLRNPPLSERGLACH